MRIRIISFIDSEGDLNESIYWFPDLSFIDQHFMLFALSRRCFDRYISNKPALCRCLMLAFALRDLN